MKLFERIKEKAMKLKNGVKAPSLWKLKVNIVAEHIFQKTIKKIEWVLELHAKDKMKIKHIQYEIIEDVDPLVGKRKEEAESIGRKEIKKWFSLAEDGEKEVKFSLPIAFENEKKRNKSGGDMHLLNHMSEISKKTAINYILHVDIRYLLDGEKESRIKTIKHTIRFE